MQVVVQGSELIDALPYVDTYNEGLRKQADVLIQAEMKRFTPPDYLAQLPPPPTPRLDDVSSRVRSVFTRAFCVYACVLCLRVRSVFTRAFCVYACVLCLRVRSVFTRAFCVYASSEQLRSRRC